MCTHSVVQEPAELHGVDVGAPQGSEGGFLLCCQSAGWTNLPPHPSALESRHTPLRHSEGVYSSYCVLMGTPNGSLATIMHA